MITTGNMIAVGARFVPLALFNPRQLFEVTMQFFNLPAHVVRILSDLRGERLIWLIGNEPVNVAVCGNQLE